MLAIKAGDSPGVPNGPELSWVEIAWLLFTGANLAAMLPLPSWETIPFHFIWISLTIVYGFRVWGSTARASCSPSSQ